MRSRFEEIATNLAVVESQIQAAVTAAGRARDEVTLIAVTKTFPISDAQSLAELGVTNFGENRDSDGAEKAASVPGTWHFQGQIQTNKLKSIMRWADVIHSVDDLRHIEIINKQLGNSDSDRSHEKKKKIDIFIQVSLDGAEGRGGLDPQLLTEVADAATRSPHINLLGLMAVAPLGQEPAEAFERLAKIHESFKSSYPMSPYLSAGMSSDFREAISWGATHIRVGSSILGIRTTPQ